MFVCIRMTRCGWVCVCVWAQRPLRQRRRSHGAAQSSSRLERRQCRCAPLVACSTHRILYRVLCSVLQLRELRYSTGVFGFLAPQPNKPPVAISSSCARVLLRHTPLTDDVLLGAQLAAELEQANQRAAALASQLHM
jgi:hypothetical protein